MLIPTAGTIISIPVPTTGVLLWTNGCPFAPSTGIFNSLDISAFTISNASRICGRYFSMPSRYVSCYWSRISTRGMFMVPSRALWIFTRTDIFGMHSKVPNGKIQ